MPRMLVTPLACISLMMGRTLAANASAISLRALMEARRAAARRGPPSFLPRALAAARAALVRSLIAPRSCSATAARMWTVSLLACVLGDELDVAVHQRGNEGEIAGEAVELGDDELGLVLAAGRPGPSGVRGDPRVCRSRPRRERWTTQSSALISALPQQLESFRSYGTAKRLRRKSDRKRRISKGKQSPWPRPKAISSGPPNGSSSTRTRRPIS